MKAAKVIATCFKPKEITENTRLAGNPLGYFYHSQNFTSTDEIINLLKLNIEIENKYDPGFDRDLIIVNADINSSKGNKFIEDINNQRIKRGKISQKQEIIVIDGLEGNPKKTRITQIQKFEGLKKKDVSFAEAGDIVLLSGIEEANIGSTLCDPLNIAPLEMLQVDKPTLCMNFLVNTSPLAGRDGKFVTSRQIRERLEKELKSNVALKVSFGQDSDIFEVYGRGELHLTILLENLRREGYELAVSRPRVVYQNKIFL